jgi:hypothetical protein
MMGNSLVLLLGLVLCLWTFLLESIPLAAKEWTAEQKEVAECFQKLVGGIMNKNILLVPMAI